MPAATIRSMILDLVLGFISGDLDLREYQVANQDLGDIDRQAGELRINKAKFRCVNAMLLFHSAETPLLLTWVQSGSTTVKRRVFVLHFASSY